MSEGGQPAGGEPKAFPDADQLLQEYSTSRDPALLNRLVSLHLSLVTRLARRLAGRSEEQLDDLIQVGYIGLLKAIDRFEPERGNKFVTYAIPTIDGEMRRYLRDKASIIRIPRHLQELRVAVDRTTEQLAQQLGRRPTIEEVATALGLDPQQVEAAKAEHLATPVSLDRPISDDSQSELAAEIARESEDLERSEDRLLLERAFQALTPRQRAILYLLFYEDLSQAQIGERLSISQMHVSRLSRAALERLREGIAHDEPKPEAQDKPSSADAEQSGGTAPKKDG